MDESADSASITAQRQAILRTRLTFDENPQPLIELHAPASSPAIDWVRTLLAQGPQPLRREHLHRQPLHAAVPTLHLIVLDTSGSMRQQGRLALATGYAAQLIEQAARAGEDVGLLSFGGNKVELIVPPGPARAAGAMRVRQRGGGGGTPLTQGLAMAERWLTAASARSGRQAVLWLLTDGRTLDLPPRPATARQIIIVDFDHPDRAIGRCALWARHWSAEHRPAYAVMPRQTWYTQG